MTPMMRRSQNWLPYVFNDLFDNDWMIKANSTAPAINVIETEKEYHVEGCCSGHDKRGFQYPYRRKRQLGRFDGEERRKER